MRRREPPIVGREVHDQKRLRPAAPVRDLDEFLEFLARIGAAFGPTKRRRRRTTGEHFLL